MSRLCYGAPASATTTGRPSTCRGRPGCGAAPPLSDEERAAFLSVVNGAFDGKVEAVGWGHDGKAIRTMLKSNAVPHQEAFLIGAGMSHQVLGDEAGLPFTKDIEGWFVCFVWCVVVVLVVFVWFF